MLRALLFVFMCSGLSAASASPQAMATPDKAAPAGRSKPPAAVVTAVTAVTSPAALETLKSLDALNKGAPVVAVQASLQENDKEKNDQKEQQDRNDYGTVIATLVVIGSIALKHIRGGKS